MDTVEIWFFAFGIVLTVVAGTAFYFLLYEKPASPFAKQKTVRVGEFDVHYHSQGSGPPVLLIHGIGSSLHCWSDIVPLLAKYYRVISIDLPGFGYSSKIERVSIWTGRASRSAGKVFDGVENQSRLYCRSFDGREPGALAGATASVAFSGSVVVIAPAAHPRLVPWGARSWADYSRGRPRGCSASQSRLSPTAIRAGCPIVCLTNTFITHWRSIRTIPPRSGLSSRQWRRFAIAAS